MSVRLQWEGRQKKGKKRISGQKKEKSGCERRRHSWKRAMKSHWKKGKRGDRRCERGGNSGRSEERGGKTLLNKWVRSSRRCRSLVWGGESMERRKWSGGAVASDCTVNSRPRGLRRTAEKKLNPRHGHKKKITR